MGVAKEQARVILPLSQYTEFYWTASFQAIVNFIELRDEPTAQWEISAICYCAEKNAAFGVVSQKLPISLVEDIYW